MDEEPQSKAYSETDRKKTFKSIWHPWRPRKIATFLWLIINKGLPNRTWRGRMGLPSKCTVCIGDHKETIEHCFQTCVEVQKAWIFFRNLRRKAELTHEPKNWEEILMGKALATNIQSYTEEIPWGADKAYTITSNTPWDMLRTNLLWHIWTQKCNHNFKEEKFNLASALFRAWQTTIQIGMAAWYEIVKYRGRRNQQRRAQLEDNCISIWTKGNIFSSNLNDSI